MYQRSVPIQTGSGCFPLLPSLRATRGINTRLGARLLQSVGDERARTGGWTGGGLRHELISTSSSYRSTKKERNSLGLVLDRRQLAAIWMIAPAPWMIPAYGAVVSRVVWRLCLAMPALACLHGCGLVVEGGGYLIYFLVT